MPFTRQSLQTLHNLSIEDVDACLKACGLPLDKPEYTDEEIKSGFEVIRGFFMTGQALDFAKAAQLFKAEIGNSKAAQPKKGKPSVTTTAPQNASPPLINFPELLKLASEQMGQRISWAHGAQLLFVCGLSDDPDYSYSDPEVELFLDVCERMNNGNDQASPDSMASGAIRSETFQTRDATISQFAQRVDEAMQPLTDLDALEVRQIINRSYRRNLALSLQNLPPSPPLDLVDVEALKVMLLEERQSRLLRSAQVELPPQP